MATTSLAALVMLLLSPIGVGFAAEVVESPEEIVVTGRQPGPPLWKIQNGDKVLWIFPYLSRIPKDMVWEYERVAGLINASQEFIALPEWSWVAPPSAMLNPLNVARNLRRSQQAQLNIDGGSLEQQLPPALFARFAALQARFFPGNDEPLNMRPLMAGRTMMNIIFKQEGLVAGDELLKNVQRLVRRNRIIKRTVITERTVLGDSFNDYENRISAVYASFPPAQEQACFEQQVRHMETELDAVKRRANGWAQGSIDEFRGRPAPLLFFAEMPACDDLFIGNASPEQAALVEMIARVHQRWLATAERALATNTSTFAILPINELLNDDGLLSKLKAKGYVIKEP